MRFRSLSRNGFVESAYNQPAEGAYGQTATGGTPSHYLYKPCPYTYSVKKWSYLSVCGSNS